MQNKKTAENAKKTDKNALLLISGGIDSPVAGKLLMDAGFNLQGIHFSQVPYTDDTPEKKSLLLARALGLKEMIVIDAGEEFKEIAENSKREYYFILIKMFMMKCTERIANEKGIEFIATGESLGQVSSQTMSNLNTINSSVQIEILRPLLFMTKQEIIDISAKEKYFEISKGPEMCDALASGRPKTRSRIIETEFEVESSKMNELVNRAVNKIRIESASKEIKLENERISICK